MHKTSNVLDLDGLAKLLKVETIDHYDDYFIENCDNYCQCSEELQEKGECECGFEDERSRLYSTYVNAVENIAEHLLTEHGLLLVKDEKKHTYQIKPQKSWREACDKIRETINGVGYFFFGSVGEFLRSGPYTPKECVLSHIGWIKSWYEVYGDTNAQSRLDRAMRY